MGVEERGECKRGREREFSRRDYVSNFQTNRARREMRCYLFSLIYAREE